MQDHELTRMKEDCAFHKKQYDVYAAFLKAYDEKDQDVLDFIEICKKDHALISHAAAYFTKFKKCKHIPMRAVWDDLLPTVLYEFYERRKEAVNKKEAELNGQEYPPPSRTQNDLWGTLGLMPTATPTIMTYQAIPTTEPIAISMDGKNLSQLFEEMVVTRKKEEEKENARVAALTEEERMKEEEERVLKQHYDHKKRRAEIDADDARREKERKNYQLAREQVWAEMKEEELSILNDLEKQGWYPKSLGVAFHTKHYGKLESYILDDHQHALVVTEPLKIKVKETNGGWLPQLDKYVFKKDLSYDVYGTGKDHSLLSLTMVNDDKVDFLACGEEVHSWFTFDRYNSDYMARL